MAICCPGALFRAPGNGCLSPAAGPPEKVCETLDAAFFDAGTLVEASPDDGVHLDVEQHKILGNALSREVADLLLP